MIDIKSFRYGNVLSHGTGDQKEYYRYGYCYSSATISVYRNSAHFTATIKDCEPVAITKDILSKIQLPATHRFQQFGGAYQLEVKRENDWVPIQTFQYIHLLENYFYFAENIEINISL